MAEGAFTPGDIADYGFLSDCQSAALISRQGSLDWLCFPRFDSAPVFARLLGREGGHWSIRPAGEHQAERRYLEGTLVLETTFRTPEGEAVLRDGLLFETGSRGHEIGMSVPHVMVRQLRGISGRVEFVCEFAPCFEYGLTHPRLERIPGGVRAAGGAVELDLFSPGVDFEIGENAARACFEVTAENPVGFTLAYSRAFPLGPVEQAVPDPGAALEDTAEAWRSWSAMHEGYQAGHQQAVRRSALVLQGLTYQPSGAVVAAATTSLPEVLGGDANWDYRFVWLRDLTLMLRALWIAACPNEPERFFQWIDRAGGRLGEVVQIMYGVEGERRLTETCAEALEGYAGSSPVRIGNAAWHQRQLDVLGEVLDGAYELREQLGELDENVRALLVALADRAAEVWQDDDAGMWEARDEERPYLSSKVMCWVALDRAIKLAGLLGAERRIADWRRARDEVRAAVLERGWCEEAGAYTGAFGSTHLDASVLLLPLVGFLPATDERMRATIFAIERELGAGGGLLKRWPGEENGFLIVSFWMVECLVLLGETEKAERRFAELLRYSNDLGLMAEMADPDGGRLLGNFPQAFSHVGLINAAWRLSQAR